MVFLALPWVIFSLFVLALVSILKRRWFQGFVLIIIGALINLWAECIPFRLSMIKNDESDVNLKVMTFNIDGSKERILNKASGIAFLIKSHNPDVVFLSEFSELYPEVLDTLLRKDYPFTSYKEQAYYSHYFYSKYPIKEHIICLPKDKRNNSTYVCGLTLKGRSLRIYGCHFPSNNFTANSTYITPDSIKNGAGIITYLNNINNAYSLRTQESKALSERIKKETCPIIIMGDFNDVGGSSVIRAFESLGLKDSWWEGGIGYGPTIHKPLPYRIDHIIHSSKLELNKIKVINSKGLSDHDALYAEFKY